MVRMTKRHHDLHFAAGFQYSKHLRDNPLRIGDVLQKRQTRDTVDGCRSKWQARSIGYQINARHWCDIKVYESRQLEPCTSNPQVQARTRPGQWWCCRIDIYRFRGIQLTKPTRAAPAGISCLHLSATFRAKKYFVALPIRGCHQDRRAGGCAFVLNTTTIATQLRI
jgi:hypothetical protein